MNEDVIEPNNYVFIRLPSATLRITKLVPNSTVYLGKFGSFFADDIIGRPYGYTYEIKDDKHVDTLYSSEGLFPSSTVDADEEEDGEETDSTPAPEDILGRTSDDTGVQKLSMTEIEALKRTASGEKIIETVIKSHSAFEKKSVYSQEKYKRRKQQKFLRRFTPCSVGSCEVIEYFQYKDHHRILELTAESLGLIMSLANIRPGGKYITIDETGGLVAGAMMERMGGEGMIMFVHENEHPNLDVMKYMNFSEAMVEHMIKTINLLQLFHPEEEEEMKILSEDILSKMKSSRRGQYYRRLARHIELQSIFQHISEGLFDGLILATTLQTKLLLDKLIPALQGSRQLVIYNTAKEPLVTTSHDLMADLRVLAPTILESRVRKFQVFPGRTHPEMTSKSGGGYVLWGTRVLPSNVQAGGKKRRKPNREKSAKITKISGTEEEDKMEIVA
ncbi:Gcd10p family-domain-containing protein [Lipomyces tetrasporus]|uniref:tRNA (adenine(58)-N(1))-methyltransferase non-catalytic subunit TRM6 n=1 Tax=Lipomyces tetrasporus TaxID=54092 RepID=A0AAD7QZX6_9ASCO|nr:Gcd10p family-domain-containing protein [Lipomyces tetrasporus]KAJ8104298.1 Gcd10p family-domain-containing protein [Lipomyces tetrasporus]